MNLNKIIANTINEISNTNITNLNKNINNLSDSDLYQIAKWGLTSEYYSSACWDDANDNIEIAINCAVTDFKSFLNIPYPYELGNIPNNPIIYRLINLNSLNDLNKSNLGKSWFSNPKQIDNPDFFTMLPHIKPSQNTYIIKASTSINNIDTKHTLWERSTQWVENEIVLINDSLQYVNIISTNKFI